MAGRRSIVWDEAVRESFRDEIDAGFAECLAVEEIPARVRAMLAPSA